MREIRKNLARVAAMAIVTTMTGCTTLVVPTYTPDYAMVDQLKRDKPGPVAIGEFTPTDPEASVNRITLRGSPFRPASGTFTDYLANAIRADLTELGVLDPRSERKINARLLRNDIDVSGMVTGEGRISVLLSITRAGATIFEREYQAETSFESSFAGPVAIPRGQIEYPRLVRTLLMRVYSDAAFLTALK